MDESRDMFGDTPPWETTEDDKPSAADLEAAGQSSMFGDPAPVPPAPAPEQAASSEQDSPDPALFASGQSAPPPSAQPLSAQPVQASSSAGGAAQPYRVLARKYRPQTFAELIGQ